MKLSVTRHTIMKKVLTLITALSLLGVVGAAESSKKKAKQGKFKIAWQITEGLKAPESAYVDEGSGFLFLSQIGDGGGKGRDRDGWISKLTVTGEMVKNRWVVGLNAPKGLRSHDGTLWVSDIDTLVAIDIATGRISKRIAIKDAQFLNDVAIGPDGSVYVSDMAASVIYRHRDGETTVFASGSEIEHPNGLLVHDGKLIIGGWGLDLQDDFSTPTVGRLQAIDLKDKSHTLITKQPTGNLDGVEIDGKGGFIVTDWRAGKVFRISRRGKVRTLMEFPRGSADHAYLVDRKWLILPEMLENKLTAFVLK
jgi:streptogramin lyase